MRITANSPCTRQQKDESSGATNLVFASDGTLGRPVSRAPRQAVWAEHWDFGQYHFLSVGFSSMRCGKTVLYDGFHFPHPTAKAAVPDL